MFKKYSKTFYKGQSDGSLSSAEVVVPLIIELLHPKSVIDFGCGVGTWLSVFKKSGIDDILGLDGKWVDKESILIPSSKFRACDLTILQHSDKMFDLAISVEVAEHLPKSSAPRFISSLTNFSKVVLFAAAIPGQRGAYHINCQWPEYWAALFKNNGYIPIDLIRSKIWNNDNVEYWYSQNIFLYVELEYLNTVATLKREYDQSRSMPLSIVHPSCFQRYADPSKMSLLRTLAMLPKLALYSFKREIKRRRI